MFGEAKGLAHLEIQLRKAREAVAKEKEKATMLASKLDIAKSEVADAKTMAKTSREDISAGPLVHTSCQTFDRTFCVCVS